MHDLLKAEGLDRFYALAGDDVIPAKVPERPASHAWLEPLLPSEGEVVSLRLDVQGVHCAACVWLFNETFRRRAGAGELQVNSALGTVQLSYRRAEFSPLAWLMDLERYGYAFGPPRKDGSRRSVELPLRLGVSAALTLNVMLFSVSFYFGLARGDDAFELFTTLSLVLSSVTVLVGGWPFFVAAGRALRSGLLHLDLPIALGIALVYGMSLVQWATSGGRGDLAYFDTLNVFITLMLLGRFVQERVIERNRRFLLEDDGADGILVRRISGPRVELVPAPKVQLDDVLLIAPGELVPIDAELLDARADVSTDWMTGESDGRRMVAGARVRAGSFNAGRSSFRVRATQTFAQSELTALLRQPPAKGQRTAKASHRRLWDAVARRWVVTVLATAAVTFLLWLPRGVEHAVNVAVSLLVITCPCAIGLALPLAYELVQSRLRSRGFYLRDADVLDRLLDVKRVVFDKTGTLTLGRLELANAEALDALDDEARGVTWNLAVRSSHPVSVVVAGALSGRAGVEYRSDAAVVEVPGKGMEWGEWRLGRASWALTSNAAPTDEVSQLAERTSTATLALTDEVGQVPHGSRDERPPRACTEDRAARRVSTATLPSTDSVGQSSQDVRPPHVRPEDGAAHREGRATHASIDQPNDSVGRTVLSHRGRAVMSFQLREVARRDARVELRSLRDAGVDVWLLSGDAQPRVSALAEELGCPPHQSLGELSPEAKAQTVRRLGGETTLYVGDGVNDALAFEAAVVAGTPAIDRPVMPSRSDFFLVGEGLAPIREALEAAHRLRRVVRRVLTLSLSYNAFAIAAAALGVMSPLAAAVSMPLSTLSLLTLTLLSLRDPARRMHQSPGMRFQSAESAPS